MNGDGDKRAPLLGGEDVMAYKRRMSIQDLRDERNDAERDGTPIGPPIDYAQPIEVVSAHGCDRCNATAEAFVAMRECLRRLLDDVHRDMDAECRAALVLADKVTR